MTLPNEERQKVLHLLLRSIAMEEIGLSRILHAEGDKIQEVIAARPSIDDLLRLNYSLDRTLRNTIKSQMLLHYKLEDMLELMRMGSFHPHEDWPDEDKLLDEDYLQERDELLKEDDLPGEDDLTEGTVSEGEGDSPEDEGFEDEGFDDEFVAEGYDVFVDDDLEG